MGKLVATGTAAVVACLLGVVVLLGGPASDVAQALPLCSTSGPVPGLSAEQAANARTIVAVTRQVETADAAHADQAAVIALMTAYQESRLRNLANPTVSGSGGLPAASGSGSDHDSVGLFQQRGSWGSVAQRMDPAWATRAFLTRLVAVPAWYLMPPGNAAQAVQISAAPDAYARWQTAAAQWLHDIEHATPGSTATPGCGGSGLTTRGTTTLPPGFALPPGTSPAAVRAVTYALAQLGKPYVFGAAGPDTFDCSGLTMAAWAAAGVTLPHYTVTQAQMGTVVAAASLLQPGDLIFIPGSDGTMAQPGHVGMYVGDGLVIEAPDTGDVVKLVPLASFRPIAAIRHMG